MGEFLLDISDLVDRLLIVEDPLFNATAVSYSIISDFKFNSLYVCWSVNILGRCCVCLVKCLNKLENINENVRLSPPIQSTEQPASRPPRFFKSAIIKSDER